MTNRRRQTIWGAAASVVIAGTIALVTILGGPPSIIPHRQDSASARTLLWLYAPRDMGRLPDRTSWCSGADHCWLAQETAGATTLADSAGSWTLDATGTPRAGVPTGLPVEDATGWADLTTELSTHTDGQSASGTGSWARASQTQGATNLVSVSAVISPVYRQATPRVLYSHRATADSTGWEVGLATNGTLYATVENSAGTTKTVKTAGVWDDGAWHAVTWILDGRTASAARIYVDGSDVTAATTDLATTGSWATTGPVTVGADAAGANVWPGGIARLRVRVGALDDPYVLAGSLWGFDPQVEGKPSADDITWVQTGATRCYRTGAATAFCGRGGRPTYAIDASVSAGRGITWPLEPTRWQRVNFGQAICGFLSGTSTKTCNAAVAPDGSKTATTITGLQNEYYRAYQVAYGYTANAPVYPTGWVRCSTGKLRIFNAAGAGLGDWLFDCATGSGGNWARVYSGMGAALTETSAWAVKSDGAFTPDFGAYYPGGTPSVDLWAWMFPEAPGDSVILIRADGRYAPVATGAIVWAINNDPPAYYCGSSGTMTLTGDWLAGGCVDVRTDATDLGRQGIDGAHWHLFNSDATEIGTANLVPSGVDVLFSQWDSTHALSGMTAFARVLRDGAVQTWDSTPLAAWTAASPTLINLDGYGATSCRANVQTIQISGPSACTAGSARPAPTLPAVIIGDSITAQWATTGAPVGLPVGVEALGIGGMQPCLFAHPDIPADTATVVLLMGINDATLYNNPVATIVGCYTSAIAHVLGHVPAATIVISTVMPTRIHDPELNRRILDLNGRLRVLGYDVIDTHRAMSCTTGVDALCATYGAVDGLHISEAGYVRWRALLDAWITGG